MNNPQYSYWLVPELKTAGSLETTISQLAEVYGGPRFYPHITLNMNPDHQAKHSALVREIVKAFSSTIEARPTGIICGSMFTKSCYMQFKLAGSLSRIAQLINDQLELGDDYHFDPHLSLFYGALGQEAQKKIVSDIILPDIISFSEIWTVRMPVVIEHPRDVTCWQVLEKVPISADRP